MDGLALSSECTFEIIEHDGMYRSCFKDTIVNNFFTLGPEGKGFLCTVTFPSSWHSRSIEANMLPYIHNKIGNYKMCVDQGRPRSRNDSLNVVGLISERQARKLAQSLRLYLLWISNIDFSL
jgi:hypothetical protein